MIIIIHKSVAVELILLVLLVSVLPHGASVGVIGSVGDATCC